VKDFLFLVARLGASATHLKLIFTADGPPSPQVVQQELLMAAEERGDYF